MKSGEAHIQRNVTGEVATHTMVKPTLKPD